MSLIAVAREDPDWIKAHEDWLRDWRSEGKTADEAHALRISAINAMYVVEKRIENASS